METIITSKEKLEDAIRFLEKKKNFEEADLKNHFNETCEQLNPINLNCIGSWLHYKTNNHWYF